MFIARAEAFESIVTLLRVFVGFYNTVNYFSRGIMIEPVPECLLKNTLSTCDYYIKVEIKNFMRCYNISADTVHLHSILFGGPNAD